MRHLRRIAIVIALALLLVVVAGCGGGATSAPSGSSGSGSSGSSGASGSSAVAVSLAGLAFNPSDIAVTVGGTVTFTNNDTVPHNVSGDGWASGTMAPGATYSHTFTAAGTFPISCTIHPSMTASVTVK